MANTAENILLFDLVFSILLISYGGVLASTNGTGVFVSIPPPQLAPQPDGSNCAWYDFICNGINSNALARATAYIGWAIINAPVLAIYFLGVIILFGNTILGIIFSSPFSANGIPFVGIFFVGLQFYVLWEVIRTFRGNSTGGV